MLKKMSYVRMGSCFGSKRYLLNVIKIADSLYLILFNIYKLETFYICHVSCVDHRKKEKCFHKCFGSVSSNEKSMIILYSTEKQNNKTIHNSFGGSEFLQYSLIIICLIQLIYLLFRKLYHLNSRI